MMVHGELWGITAEGWVAIATFAGGLAVLLSGAAVIFAARYAAKRFLGEQEARDVRRYLVDEGVWKLRDSLDRTLQTVSLNYVQCVHLIALVRDHPAGGAGAPQLEDLPSLYPIEHQDYAISAIRTASRALDSEELKDLTSYAFAIIQDTNAILTNEIGRSVRTYYSGERTLSDEQRWELVKHLDERADEAIEKMGKVADLPGWLEDAGRRVQEMRVARFDEIDRVQDDPEIASLREKIRAMSEALHAEDDKE